MEASKPLIISFYQSLFSDVSDLLPSEPLQTSLTFLMERNWPDFIRPLSALGKSFESTLISGVKLLVPDEFELEPGTELPKFCFCLFTAILNDAGYRRYTYDGGVRDTLTFEFDGYVQAKRIQPLYVLILRQILLAWSKVTDIETIASEQDEINSFVQRIQTPGDVRLDSGTLSWARYLLRTLFTEDGELDASIQQWIEDPFGRHGPGAVFDGSQGSEKWDFQRKSGLDDRAYGLYPHTSPRSYDLSEDSPLMSRLCVVPKDFRAHRLICIESKEAMFHQQGLLQVINSLVSRHFLTRRSIDFTSQTRSMCISKDMRNATIDLSDASDRVSLQLCRLILPRSLFSLLTRYRSRMIELPDGQLVSDYETMFTMGNALCFPTETLVFWAISLAAMLNADSERVSDYPESSQLAKLLARYRLRVFGDDIIIPTRYYEPVRCALINSGLVVNTAKSCDSTLVREACGSWWYMSTDVRITRFHYTEVASLREWISLLEAAKELYRNGFHLAARSVLNELEATHSVPYGYFGLPGQCKLEGNCFRWNSSLQRMEFKTPSLITSEGLTCLPGEVGFYAYFTQQATKAVIPADAQRIIWIWVGLE